MMDTQQTMISQTIRPEHHPHRVFLARHGQSASNCEGRIAGQLNPPLTEKGQRQALRLSTVLQDIRLTKVVTSSLSRSIETAKPTAERQGLTACSLAGINEISFGILEGRLRHDLDRDSQNILDQWTRDKANFRIPSGENLIDVRRRAIPALSRVFRENPGDNILIVGHRHTNLVILSALLGWDLHSIKDTSIQSKYVYELHLAPTPRIYTICLTGEARGRRLEGFLSGDAAMSSYKERGLGS
ncbi:MAG: histidine phosphatase family protein [Nitrospira sp.]|nr:MAG: histidine phosphatase family protein [Nitrospira sp.]